MFILSWRGRGKEEVQEERFEAVSTGRRRYGMRVD